MTAVGDLVAPENLAHKLDRLATWLEIAEKQFGGLPEEASLEQAWEAMREAARILTAAPANELGKRYWRAVQDFAHKTGCVAGGDILKRLSEKGDELVIQHRAKVAEIVPKHCAGSAFCFTPGVLCVNKDGSGYIAIDEADFVCEDDRCEGPDGPEGSIHWIVRMDASEMQSLCDFLNGANVSTPPPPQASSEDRLREILAQEIEKLGWKKDAADIRKGVELNLVLCAALAALRRAKGE